MEIGAALAAANAGEGGDGVPVAVAVTEKNRFHVILRIRVPKSSTSTYYMNLCLLMFINMLSTML